ncbi:MAG: DUF2927 domain-containing protein [Pseudomonadota bacterium]
MTGILLRASALILMACAAFSCLAAQDTKDVLQLYFGQSYRLSSGNRGDADCLQKFAVLPALQASEQFKAEADGILDELHTALQSLIELAPGGAGDRAVLFRFEGNRDDHHSEAYKAQCSAQRRVNAGCEILSATVRLPSGLNSNEMRYCIFHETLHALGYRGHVWSQNSVMNPTMTLERFSTWDQSVIKRLYGGALKAGMQPAEVSKLLREMP